MAAVVVVLGVVGGLIALWQGGEAILKLLFGRPRVVVEFVERTDGGQTILVVEVENEPIYSAALRHLVSRRVIDELEISAKIFEEQASAMDVTTDLVHDPSGDHHGIPLRLPPSYRRAWMGVVMTDEYGAFTTARDGMQTYLAPGTHECRVLFHDGAESFKPEVHSRQFTVHDEPHMTAWVGAAQRLS